LKVLFHQNLHLHLLAQEQAASSLSIPKMPPHLIAALILPFVADRATWNSLCSASKELYAARKNKTPPWPNKSFNIGRNVRHLALSPCGSQLAFCILNYDTRPYYVSHVWDRCGRETLLEGHTEYIYIARNTRLIGRIWRQEAEMDRFESGVENRFIALLQIQTAKEAHGHQNKPSQLF
jgi:hypothetical protein